MTSKLFAHYAPLIRSLDASELDGSQSLTAKLRLEQEGTIEICYVPFEYINPAARVVIVGITPGRTQLVNAIKEARRQLDLGMDHESALRAAKQTGAFSGAMRPNLINLLDCVGLHNWLGIQSCAQLFDTASHLVQTTSVLRNAVFIDGGNYSGTPSMLRQPLLRDHLLKYFGEDVRALPDAVYVPLGDKVAEALHFLVSQGMLRSNQILDGLPHPSGANAERIAYFLGKKARGALSAKTDPNKLDAARELMLRKVASLPPVR